MDRKLARALLTIRPSSTGAAPLGRSARSAERPAGPVPAACGPGALHAEAHPAINSNHARLEASVTTHLLTALAADAHPAVLRWMSQRDGNSV
ncbi:hypothetical protein [Sorangium sp. So ce145]|uniref:hypothetical protein n=1 Tax=Sorangium sp. So ce145 TaxID=3133285 RepID=UPI003F642BB3